MKAELELGYLAVPDGGGPGVVVVHDVWGLYEHFRDVARRLAAEGFVVLAVDLYRGLAERPRGDDPGAFLRELPDPDVLATLRRAVDFVSAHPDTRGGTGVVGFCMGGSYALLAGALVSGVRAIVPFYGVLSYETGLYASATPLSPMKKPMAPLDAARRLVCPVCAFYGDEDAFVSLDDIRELERRVQAKDPDARVKVYAGAGHAFANDTRPQAYRPEAALDAWGTMTAFLHRHLDAERPA